MFTDIFFGGQPNDWVGGPHPPNGMDHMIQIGKIH